MADLKLPELVHRVGSGISFFSDDRLFEATGIRVAFTERHGGFSKGDYESLNLGIHVEDDESAVLSNRNLVLKALGASSETKLVCPNQVHGSKVCEILTPSGSQFEAAFDEAKKGADALLVACKGVCAMLCYADCVPVILASPNGKFAVIHAGWRGVVSKIAGKALMRLCEVSHTCASQINAYIGPYIHEECFEVGEDTYKTFEEKFAACIDLVCKKDRRVNLGEACSATLIEAGMSSERIADLGICTYCNSDDFFSYRASKGRCGRHAALAFRS